LVILCQVGEWNGTSPDNLTKEKAARIKNSRQIFLWLIGGQGLICPVTQFRIQADKRKAVYEYEKN